MWLVMAILVAWMLSRLRGKQAEPDPPEKPTEPARPRTAEAIPQEIRSLIPRPQRTASYTNANPQEVLVYSPPFRPKSMIPKPLRGNLHAQQLLIVLEEAQVNPAIIQLEFRNIYNRLGSIKDLEARNAADIVRRREKITDILNRTKHDPDALEEEMSWRDGDAFSGPLVYERIIRQHREAIQAALEGTRIASEPELQEKLFSIQVQLDLSTEAIEFMKSYSPAPPTTTP